MRRGLALTLLLLAGCANDPVRYGNSNNKAVHADLLFEQEGCKVYRFEDSGEPHYYVVCESGNATATTELSYMAGKVVMHRADEIPTVKLIPPQKWRAPEPVASTEKPPQIGSIVPNNKPGVQRATLNGADFSAVGYIPEMETYSPSKCGDIVVTTTVRRRP